MRFHVVKRDNCPLWKKLGLYLLAVAALNRALHTNYLFLSAAPAGTPLQWLYARGGGYYVCALSMLCMTLFRLLADAYRRAAISGNR